MNSRPDCPCFRISLVNASVVSYFTEELGLHSHFEALRRYLLMEDGEFSHCLSTNLFEKVLLRSTSACLYNTLI